MRTLACFVVVLAACASSTRPGQQCDPTTTTCVADAGPEADAPPDGPPLKGFGEACSDGKQCESSLCILVGTSGQCTKLCGDCPDGYGCLAVEGIQIEGTVSFVCVPTSNQLCTTCTQDSECTLIGMDKCVTYPDGDRTCARDCTTVGCPVGYDCETVPIAGVNYQQCMASSGACDCTAANPGAMQPCNITTPWNVCLGAQTCGGASGWNTCAPPSQVDDPDATFVDSNCDGLDGDRMRAIFVSGAGSNSATCGLDYTDPCQTIQFAITRAVAAARPHVYVQSGTYTGSLAMTNGISIFGGYNVNWVRAPYVDAGHTVTLLGGVVAVRFDAITASTMLDNIIVRSANATGTGASSIGVLVTGSTNVALRGVQVDPGAGTAGAAGSGGTPGNNGGNGAPGNPGREDSTAFGCNNNGIPPGGAGGSSTCSRSGGTGGTPGSGGNNGNAGGTGSIGTAGGAGATCNSNRACDGQPGSNGTSGTAGMAGSRGLGFGSFSGSTYLAASGAGGLSGSAGNGGGGGGGGGGGTNNCDSTGSSGGGGGAGGCGGVRGLGGTGGGGSFGVVAIDSTVVVTASILEGGTGGNGGTGGTGGAGGFGGQGGQGGGYGGPDDQDDGGDGAAGGDGGNGGRGGDGGGGGGGPSIGIVCIGASTTNVSINGSTLTAGTGGAGGASASPGMTGLAAPSLECPP